MSVPLTMGDNVSVIERQYAQSATYQWVREVAVNSMQAAATEIRFGTEWQAVEALGVHRRIVIDNGEGIPRAHMLGFLNKFGASGRALGATFQNYGIGVKTSALPWNKYGLVVISRHDGEDSMLWLHYDESQQCYGARTFDVGNESGVDEAVVPLGEVVTGDAEDSTDYVVDGIDWNKILPENIEHGTAVVFLGNAKDQHTVLGDPARDESNKYGIVRFLNRSFITIPEDVSIWVEQYENASGDPKDWPKSPKDQVQGRYAIGVERSLAIAYTPSDAHPERDLTASGTMEIPATTNTPGARLRWWLSATPQRVAGSNTTGAYAPTFPFFGLQYSAHDEIVETFGAKDSTSAFVKPNDVNARLSVIIEPIKDDVHDVFPNDVRSTLLYTSPVKSGDVLPMGLWQAYWHDHMPAEVRKALDDYYLSTASSTDALTKDDVQRLGQRFLPYFHKIEALAAKAGGDKILSSGGKRVFRRRKSKKATSSSTTAPPNSSDNGAPGDGQTAAATRRTKRSMVDVSIGNDPESLWVVIYDRAEHRAVINTASDVYKVTLEAVADTHSERRGRDLTAGEYEAVRAGVDTAMQTLVCTAVTHAESIVVKDQTLADDVLSDAALSTCLLGIKSVMDLSAGSIGQRLGAPKSNKAAA